jgi:hypothetical protein
MLVSTFELLVKPITPANAGPASLARTIVQGYFLTIANTSNAAVTLRLTFRATTPSIDLAKTVTIIDITGTNVFGDLTAANTFDLTLAANDTGLFILQPDVTIPSVLAGQDLEIRGYVEIDRLGFGIGVNVLLTPEHRGTFFSGSVNAPGSDIDQLVYALPTALGQSLYNLNGLNKPIKEFVDVPNIPLPLAKGSPELAANPPILPNNIQEVLVNMAQQIDALSAAAEGRAFIQPNERPIVGQQIVNPK